MLPRAVLIPALVRNFAARSRAATGARRLITTMTTPGTAADEHKFKELRGGRIAKGIFDKCRVDAAALADAGWAPRLLSVSIGDEDASGMYIRNQKRIANKLGIEFEELDLPSTSSRGEVLATLAARNADPSVTGIIIQRPVPAHFDVKEVQQAVHPMKDVEGMHPASLGQVVYNEADLAPCTAKAAVELLRATGLSLPGLQCVVVGHSEIVGKPISFLLLSEGCTVTICNHMTHNLAQHTRQADALFVAVGKAGLVSADMVKPGAAVIDVGINQSAEGGVVGDVDFESVLPVAGWLTPVPGGVGTVTTAMLMANTIVAAQRQQRHYEAAFGPEHVQTNAAMSTSHAVGRA